MTESVSVADLIRSVDIVEYISQYMDLEMRVDGEYWGISCLSDHDTDPSFSVNPDKQCFWDFSSHKGGDILAFIQSYHKCGFLRAVTILQDYADAHGVHPEHVQELNCTKEILKYSMPKKKVKEAKYVNLGDDCMDKYVEDWEKTACWEDEGISREAMKFFKVRFDPLSDRIVFPIRAMDGTIINVCGRTIDPDFKEKKLRKYTYFYPLGRFDTLYGFYENAQEILDKGEIIVFEGQKSVMKAWSWGIKNAVALCTSHMNIYQFVLFLKLGVRVVFALDTDADILKDENVIRLTKYLPIESVVNFGGLLGEKMAPVDAGKEVWEKLYAKRRGVVRIRA